MSTFFFDKISTSFKKNATHNTRDDSMTAEPEQWRLREAIGRYGTFIIISGSITIPILFGLLYALWSGKVGDIGEHSSNEWRFIVLRGWTTEAVTLLSMGCQICASLQSLICTSLAAATILETSGVRLSQLAEISMMRGANDGPWRLAYLTMTSSYRRIWSLQPILVVFLYLSTLASHFGSTILVTDLESIEILGSTNHTVVNMTTPAKALSARHLPSSWYMPPSYTTFGEVQSGMNADPTPLGFSDTGNRKRIFLPLSAANISTTRSYEGTAYGWNTRVSCAAPMFNGAHFRATNPGVKQLQSLPFLINFVGNISYGDTLTAAGVNVPPLCANGGCLPSQFNCTVLAAGVNGTEGMDFCVPDSQNVVNASRPAWLSDGRSEPLNANSMVFLITRTTGMYSDWEIIQKSGEMPKSIVRRDEWYEWTFSTGFKFAASVCFSSSIWERSQVQLSAREPTYVATPVAYTGFNIGYDTTKVRKQLGATSQNYTNSERGLFTVDSITNTSTSFNKTFYYNIQSWYLVAGSQVGRTTGFVMFAGTTSQGSADVNPFVDYAGLFQDVYLDTGRPALALQALWSLKMSNVYYGAQSLLIMPEEVLVTEAQLVQAPVRFTGLFIFTAIMLVNFTCVVAITATFLLKTRYSKQGHFWHTISQVITDDTVTILQHAAESRDDHAMARTNTLNSNISSSGPTAFPPGGGEKRKPSFKLEHDPVVVVSRSVKTGRVQVIRKDELGSV